MAEDNYKEGSINGSVLIQVCSQKRIRTLCPNNCNTGHFYFYSSQLSAHRRVTSRIERLSFYLVLPSLTFHVHSTKSFVVTRWYHVPPERQYCKATARFGRNFKVE